MKWLTKLGRVYCIVAGALLAPAVLALVLAHFTGQFPDRPLERVVQALQKQPEAPDVDPVQDAQKAAELEENRAPDVRLWARRLEQVGDGILHDVKNLEEGLARLEQERAQQEQVLAGTTRLLSVLLGEEVETQQIHTETEALVARLEQEAVVKDRLPWLLETLGAMNAKAIAALLQGMPAEGTDGLREGEAVALLGGLTPRKVGQVLTELGKANPLLAGRLLAQLGRDESPGGSPEGKGQAK